MKDIKPIPTTAECPNCKTKIDISAIKNHIKQRMDEELDYILEKL